MLQNQDTVQSFYILCDESRDFEAKMQIFTAA
jgi:hypothetical protein